MVGVWYHCVWLMASLAATSSEQTAQCSDLIPGGVHFTIGSSRNHTGHWNTLVQLNHESNSKGSDHLETGSWEVDVKQNVQKCSEREVIGIVASVTAPHVRAGPGYELVPGMGYYKLHTKTKPWLEARQTCFDEGAHLAIVNSDQEMKILQRIFQLHPKITDGWMNDCVHLGFHDMFVEGQYVTVFGDPLETTGHAKFNPGEPSDKTEVENCGCTCRNKGLFDVGCTSSLPFFCEQEMQ